ncbi:MAG: VIT1/CCC1 transporter family protein [Candidatus Omnitrophota bacterium]|nr:MAG: VIT1/CCC1 transporter family protein [Candidatus Omnitrophota bacterium]
MELSADLKKAVLTAQKNELTEYIIYKKLAAIIKDEHNNKLLAQISQDELRHHNFWQKLTNRSVRADKLKIFIYVFLARFLGLTFAVKLMERGEDLAQDAYERLKHISSEVEGIIQDENRHEKELLNVIDEERLKYIGSVVLGLNDALVELTGALAGLTLALQRTRLIAMVGLITGIAAALSMAASEYLSTKQEETEKNPVKASIYTGFAYILTVLFLVFPYFLFANVFFSLGTMMVNALVVIAFFTFYISIAKEVSFRNRFLEMAGLSLSVAVISFFIGMLIRNVFGIDV